ncbi:Rad9-domain-containing protein [Neurospora tetraspora]|uniref:DNA repair protein rad9 n=1 Tax=Neurospora tetraspora TaxID=94610 RepID=A0AAE0JC00_9PEZI|nr:Rad9-domain-containing protein [Neurospora tetraspora]
MVILNFTLSEEGVSVFHDALACMYKFSDDVCLEARKDKLTLTTLNISKSAYVCFTFAANRFFSRYHFEGNAQYRDRFFCQLYIRSLLSIFRSRQGGDSARDKDASIERCDVAIDDGPGKKSRLIARVSCRNGITASHSLPFESKPPTHAKFDKDEAGNRWSISSNTLRQLMDHFGPGIELLDINTDDDDHVVNFTCFTDKVQKRGPHSNEAVLKKPLHTNISVEMAEFDEVDVQDKLHIIISVKDFRAILQHAQITSGELATYYSEPGRPMKLSYSADGILCEFILMTVGEQDAITQKHKNTRARASKTPKSGPGPSPASKPDGSVASNQAKEVPKPAQNPPQQKTPPRPRQTQFEIRPPPVPPRPPVTARSDRSDSPLFVEQGDEDQQWEPVDHEDEDEVDNARVEWNATGEPNPSSLRISSLLARPAVPGNEPDRLAGGLEPTQQLSEACNMWSPMLVLLLTGDQVRRFGLFSS